MKRTPLLALPVALFAASCTTIYFDYSFFGTNNGYMTNTTANQYWQGPFKLPVAASRIAGSM